MKSVPLYQKINQEYVAKAWVCESCKRVANSIEQAESCCVCRGCGGREKSTPWGLCGGCQDNKEAESYERELQALEDTSATDDYDGPVWSPTGIGSWDDGYSSDAATFLESWYDNEEGQPPNKVYACTEHFPILSINTEQVIEYMTEDSVAGDYEPDINGLEELREAIEVFKRANRHVLHYHIDKKQAVNVPVENGK